MDWRQDKKKSLVRRQNALLPLSGDGHEIQRGTNPRRGSQNRGKMDDERLTLKKKNTLW